jgi:hypothetical protein
MNVMTRLQHWLAAAATATLLGACGGGGGDSPAAAAPVLLAPPTTAATLQSTSTEASGAAAATADSAQRLVQLSASLNGNLPLARSGTAALSWSRAALSASREQPLATRSVTCADFFGSTACSGSLTVDTNATGTGSVIPAGTYATLTFSALQGSVGGSPVLLNGTLRLDYLTSFDINAATPAGLRFQLTFSGFSGTAEGVSFGPLSAIALYEFDAQGVGLLTIDGLRITGFETMTVTDANNYSLPDVTVRRAHWATPAGHVDLHYSNWSVVSGRPAVNSTATISVPGSSVTVIVRESSATSVVYEVNASVNGTVLSYAVTATFPAGGGAPTYTVVAMLG